MLGGGFGGTCLEFGVVLNVLRGLWVRCWRAPEDVEGACGGSSFEAGRRSALVQLEEASAVLVVKRVVAADVGLEDS